VEDEEMLRTVCGQFLKSLGYRVLDAAGPAAALDLAVRFEGSIHVLLTDMIMPGMNGRQLAEKLAAIKPGLKVLYMSGYTADMIDVQDVLGSGAQFLGKPFSRDDLGSKLRELLGAPPAG
jgi:CheY-like chemotaxis protein